MLVPRIKVLVLSFFLLQMPGGPEANIWLQFGQLAGIIFISWLVIKRGTKSGDQDVSFWTARFDELKAEIAALRHEIENQRRRD